MADEFHHIDSEPDKTTGIDAEYLSGRRYPYQEDRALSRTSTCSPATPGGDINWLEDIEMLRRTAPGGVRPVQNAFLQDLLPDPRQAASNEIARKVLLLHLQSGNSYGIQLKPMHTKFPQPQLGSWTEGSPTVGTDWTLPVLEGWTPSVH